jgi:hypothetical protein
MEKISNLDTDNLPLPQLPPNETLTPVTYLHFQSYIDKQKNKLKMIKIPKIPPNTVIVQQPLMLLRQFAQQHDYYNLNDLIKRLIDYDTNNKEYSDEFRLQLVYEIASNISLKEQMKKINLFDEWIAESENITFNPF